MTDEIPVTAPTPEAAPLIDLTVDTSGLLKCYGILIIGTPLLYLTYIVPALVGFFMVASAVLWNRKTAKKRDEALIANHTRWIRRTFWLSVLFSCFAATICWMIFTTHADQSGMAEMIKGMQNASLTPEQVQEILDRFYADNADLILWNWVGCFSPVVLHALIRYIKGYRAADAGRYIQNVTTWWL